jgi:hypothetical protein
MNTQHIAGLHVEGSFAREIAFGRSTGRLQAIDPAFPRLATR